MQSMLRQQPPRRLPRWALPVGAMLVLVCLVWLIWNLAQNQSGIRREAPKLSTIIPLPPPPPPPEKKQPEPEKVVEEKTVVEPEPTPMEQVEPADDAPKPANDEQQAMTMDAAGQAGSDSFNIGAGSGGGMAGSGAGRGGTGTYAQYMSYALQRLIQNDERTRRLVFRVQVDIWLDADGRLIKVELTKSSGNDDTDRMVLSVLRTSDRLAERPLPNQEFPAHVEIIGRGPT